MTPSPEEIEEWLRRLTVESELAPQEAKEFVQYFRELQERAKAFESSLLFFAAECHRRKWLFEDDGTNTFYELDKLGCEIKAKWEESRLLTTKGER